MGAQLNLQGEYVIQNFFKSATQVGLKICLNLTNILSNIHFFDPPTPGFQQRILLTA
jgi:hypothetical protein